MRKKPNWIYDVNIFAVLTLEKWFYQFQNGKRNHRLSQFCHVYLVLFSNNRHLLPKLLKYIQFIKFSWKQLVSKCVKCNHLIMLDGANKMPSISIGNPIDILTTFFQILSHIMYYYPFNVDKFFFFIFFFLFKDL